MNKKGLFKVTITDADGKVMLESESDCIMAAFSEPANSTEGKTAIRCVNAHRCNTSTLIGTLKALNSIKADVLKGEPQLGLYLAMDALGGLADKLGGKSDRKDDDTED